MDRRVVYFEGRGHPSVRATHAKTLELTASAEITGRATCVVGVSMTASGPVDLMRGPVRMTLQIDDQVATGYGLINPANDTTNRVVLRRSDVGGASTLVVRSTLTAADLDPALVERLKMPEAHVRLTVTEVGATPSGPPRGALVLVDTGEGWAHHARLGNYWAAADCTVDLRLPLRAETLDVVRKAGIVAAAGLSDQLPARKRKSAATHLRALVSHTGGVRVAVPTRNPLSELLLASGLPPDPVLWLGLVRKPRDVGAALPAAVPAVLRLSRESAATALAALVQTHPDHPVAVQDAWSDMGTAARWTTAAATGAAVVQHPSHTPLVAITASDAGARGQLEAVARALIDAGVPPRTVGVALAPFGLGRRALYANDSAPRPHTMHSLPGYR